VIPTQERTDNRSITLKYPPLIAQEVVGCGPATPLNTNRDSGTYGILSVRNLLTGKNWFCINHLIGIATVLTYRRYSIYYPKGARKTKNWFRIRQLIGTGTMKKYQWKRNCGRKFTEVFSNIWAILYSAQGKRKGTVPHIRLIVQVQLPHRWFRAVHCGARYGTVPYTMFIVQVLLPYRWFRTVRCPVPYRTIPYTMRVA